MSGKQKQAQRTKGNVKASSSARAVELLASTTQAGTGLDFVGFGSMAGELCYVPAVSGAEDLESSIDSDFRLILRKLSKRDTTTKMKALHEFSMLCQEKEAANIKTVLPFWPRIYNKSSIDTDPRVREATQHAFEQLVLKVRRNLAPHLKDVIGTWLVAQHDTYSPAATAAKSAFATAFPPNKQSEVLVFCRDEIITHVQDNLIQTVQKTSDSKSANIEDSSGRSYHILCASLAAFRTILSIAQGEHKLSMVDAYRTLLTDKQFWKCAKQRQPMVQGAFYSVLSAICQHQPGLARDYADNISTSVLHNLDNTEPSACGPLWEAVLSTVCTINDCWQRVNLQKGMLPGLWRMLLQAGSGSAAIIYPNLLPYLSHLPVDVTGNVEKFYKDFFSNFKTGLMEEKLLINQKEAEAVIQAFMECLQYVISQNLSEKSILDHLVHDQLVQLLRASIFYKVDILSTSSLYPATVRILMYLHEKSFNGDSTISSVSAIMINEILQAFQELSILSTDNDAAIQRFAMFLCSFKGIMPKHKEKMVKNNSPDRVMQTETNSQKESSLVSDNGPVFIMICGSCCEAYEKSHSIKAMSSLMFFSRLFKVYASEPLLKAVWILPKTDLLPNIIRPWMKIYQDPSLDQNICNAFVDIISRLFELCCTEDRTLFLSAAVEHILSMEVFNGFVQNVIKHNTEDDVTAWFRGQEFGSKMVDEVKTLCQHRFSPCNDSMQLDEKSPWTILTMTTISGEKFSSILEENYLTDIVQVIVESLPSIASMAVMSPDEIKLCAAPVCYFTNNISHIKGCSSLPAAQELYKHVFQMLCMDYISQSEELTTEIQKALLEGMESILALEQQLASDSGFFKQVGKYLKSCVTGNEGQSFDSFQGLVSATIFLCRSIGETLAGKSSAFLACPSVLGFLKDIYVPFNHANMTQWNTSTSDSEQLMLDSVAPDLVDFTPAISVSACLVPGAYTSELLTAVILDHLQNDVPLVFHDMDIQLVLDLTYAAVLSNVLISGKRKVTNRNDFAKFSQLLDDNLSAIMKHLPSDVVLCVLEETLHKSLREGNIWSLCLQRLLRNNHKKEYIEKLLHTIGGLDRFTDLTVASLHTMHALLPQLDQKTVDQLMDQRATLMLITTPDTIATLSGGCGGLSLLSQILPQSSSNTCHANILVSVLDHIRTFREDHNLLLFDSCISQRKWTSVSLNIVLMRFMEMLVRCCPMKLTDKSWDFILCGLVSWVQSCNESEKYMMSEPKTQAFCAATFNLLSEVVHCMNVILPKDPGAFPGNLATEWKEFFSDGIFSLLLPLFVKQNESVDESSSCHRDVMLCSLASAVSLCPIDNIIKHQLPPKLVAEDDDSLPSEIQTALNHLCPMLLNTNRATNFGTYRILKSLVSDLSQYDTQERMDTDDKPARSPPGALMSVLLSSSDTLDVLLSHNVTPEEVVIIETDSEQYTITMAYLLSWRLLLSFFRGARVELRAEYAQYLKDHCLVDHLLTNLYRLMPKNPVIQLQGVVSYEHPKQNSSPVMSMFAEEPALDIMGPAVLTDVPHMACCVYSCALMDLPAILRHWYNSLDRQIADLVDRYTTKYISPILVSQELSDVQQDHVKLDNMTIKTHPASREVVATYVIEEIAMELVVTLPANHPLGQITVDCGKRIGVATAQWRNWMLQLTTFLHKQNGSILDGLTLWRRNLDKRFDGVEECLICFSVIHGTNCQLPKLKCKTCKKKFHSACLYKWFNTSNNSTCPMCRNLF